MTPPYPLQMSHVKFVKVILISTYQYKTHKLNKQQWQIKIHLIELSSIKDLIFIQLPHIISEKVYYWENQEG